MVYEKHLNNFVCSNTYLRLVNQTIYEEYVFEKWNKTKNIWAKKARSRLKKTYGINVSLNTLTNNLLKIKKKERNPIAASCFISDKYEGKSSSRYEKDMMHSQMDILRHQFIFEKTNYIGLPANQIVSVSNKYDYIVACEKNFLMAQFMSDMNKYISKNNNLVVKNLDIFEYIKDNEKYFNIFELDLMTYVNMDLINKIVNCLNKASMNRSLVAITTIGGRKITINEYRRIMPSKLVSALSNNFTVINKPFSGKYKDHKMPMMYELFVIERR